jgi:long-chain fatty acid transport protein
MRGTQPALRLSLGLVAMLLAFPRSADAAGLYFSDRGVRPMGRGGAFVAGADDLGAIWYNPAGLADAGTSVLADFSWLHFTVDYTRVLQVQDSGGAYQRITSPTVSGDTPILPLPTIAASWAFGDDHEFTAAAGVLAPYIALTAYPSTVQGQPSPARYSLGSYNGSIAAIPGVWLAYKPVEQLRVGLGFLAFTGKFQSTITFNANPQDRILCAPECPDFDANAQLDINPIFAPSGSAGITWIPIPALRLAASGQLPMIISAPATIKMQMPASSLFDQAYQNGEDAHVRFALPGIVRAGVELRPLRPSARKSSRAGRMAADPSGRGVDLRIEATYVREFWSAEQSVDITPHGMSIDGVSGFPPMKIPPLSIPRGFVDAWSVRLGGELEYSLGGYRLATRIGISHETSAVPTPLLNLSALDFDKWTASLGGAIHIGKHWRFDGVWAHTFVGSVWVDPSTAQFPRINPIPGNAKPEYVNGGTYRAAADLFGVGLNYSF